MPHSRARSSAFGSCLFFLTLALTSCSTALTDPKDAFRNKTVRILVAFSAGGGYDLYARVMAEHLGRHLPGAPTVVVENMPGAGGVVAGNYLAHQARPDGLTIGMLGPGAVIPQLLGSSGVQYDIRQLTAIGAPMSETHDVCIAAKKSGIDLAAWRSRPGGVRVATFGRGSAPHLRAAFLASALHLQGRLVSGYRGTPEVLLALEGGEVDVYCLGLVAYRSLVEPAGNAVMILQSEDDPNLLVPSAARLVQDERGRGLLDLVNAMRAVDRFYVAPPGLSEVVVKMLRDGFDATMRDEQFLTAARTARLDIHPVTANDLAARIAGILNLPDAARRTVIDLLSAEELR